MQNNIILEDTTLCSGEQAPGVAYSKDTKVEIYKALVEIGVKWIEVGIPALGGSELDSVRMINDMAHAEGVVALAYSKGIMEDVKSSLSLGINAIHLGLPTASKSLKYEPNWIMTQTKELVKFVKDKDVFVSISAMDISRTELSFLQDYACMVQEAGADRLRLPDSTGRLMPDKYKSIVEAVKKVTTIDIQCHAPNDYGFALANTLAALEGGARYFNVTVNGLGERAGMTDFAQAALALYRFYELDLGIDLGKLTSLSRLVENHTKIPVCTYSPVIGAKIFTYESEMFEPFSPELVGGRREIVLGKHSSKNTIKHKLELLGIHEVSDHILDSCLSGIQEKVVKNDYKALDLNKELLEIYNRVA